MFKTIKKITSCFLALCLLLSIAPMGVFATETINYVSIGDSMTNGYCFDGYNQGGSLPDFINNNDNGVYGDAAYPELIADWLKGNYATVNHTRLAPSAMRAEDLLYLLGGREAPADDWYGQVENYTNCDDDAALSQFFTESVTDADLITMGIGNASFGAFLLQHVTDAIGVMGNSPDIDPDITLANALDLLGAEQQDVVMQVYDYMKNELDKYIPADMQTRFNIPAVLDITAYTTAGFILNYKNVIERIVELNPDVEIILVGLMNTTYGMNITADGIPSIPVGDIMDGVFGALNAYIAGLPAAMQAAGHYPDAKFYYTGIDEIEFIVQRFDDLRDGDWGVAPDGLSGEIVRARTIKSYDSALRPMIADAISTTLPSIDLDNVEEYEEYSTWEAVVMDGKNTSIATSVAIYLAIEDALAASIGTMDIPLNDLASIAGDISAVFSGLNPDSSSPAALRASLGEYLSADSLKPLCKIYSLFKIGDGMSVHPTPVAHADLAAKIISAYENGYTAEDKVIDTAIALAELIAKYGEEAVERVYTYLENEGYIAELEAAIDGLLADLENPDSDLSQKLVAETDKLLAILEAETGEELPSGEEVITAIRNYEETLVELEEYIANNEEIQEAIAEVEAIIAQINDIIANPEAYIQNIIDDIVAKYEEKLEAATKADYVACGENHYVAFAGTNTAGVEDYEYSYQVAAYIDDEATSHHNFTDGTPIKDLAAYITSLEGESLEALEDATIITYQIDAKDIVLPLFVDDVVVTDADWEALLGVDASKVAEIKETITTALTGGYAEEGTEALNNGIDKALDIKEKIMTKLPEDWAATLVENGAKADEVIDTILTTAIDVVNYNLDEEIVNIAAPYTEELVFNTVAYLINNIKSLEAIKAINPDALIAVVGLNNPVKGLTANINGETINLGEYVEYFIEATNVYNTIYASASENVIFVEADGAEIAGYQGAINIDTSNLSTIGNAIVPLSYKIANGAVVTEAGHNYIANQIKEAIALVDHIDEDGDDICDKCEENLAPVTPTPTPTPGTPGPSGSGRPIKEETPASTFKFTDVSKDAWYYDVIKKVVDKGLMNGISETQFAPELEVTRGMFVTILYRAAGEPEVSAATNFADVTADKYYAKAVAWANANGIVKGITETEFAPDNNITREQMATILYRYAKNKAAAEVNYTDKHAISDYAMEAVAWAKAAGIMQGNADGTFAPVRNASRAEAAAVFVRMFKL